MKSKLSLILMLLILILPVTFYALFKSPAMSGGLKAASGQPMVLEFSSSLCSECQKLKKVLDKVEPKYEDKISFQKINAGVMDEDTLEKIQKYEVKVDTDSLFKKIKFTAKRKNGVVTYEIVNLYQCARQGYNLTDPLVRATEVLIAICDWYEYATGDNYLGVSKESIEKYDIPNKSWSEKKMFE